MTPAIFVIRISASLNIHWYPDKGISFVLKSELFWINKKNSTDCVRFSFDLKNYADEKKWKQASCRTKQ